MAAGSHAERVAPRLGSVVARLTGANVLGAAAGLATGPLLARALGAGGRGDLAAVLIPLALAPYILSLGIPAFANRELPRGRPINEVVGALGLTLFALGLVGAAAAVPVAEALAEGRETVRLGLIVSFVLLPVLMVGGLLYASLAGLERWHRVVAARLTSMLVPLVAIVGLYAFDRLTVGTAAASVILGAVLSLIPGLPLLIEGGRPVFRPAVAKEGISFGVKTWIGSLALIANSRLDQLVMITVVSSRELGLYAVAVTLAGASTLVTGAVTPPLTARVAAGEPELVPRVTRVTLAASLALGLLLAAVAPVLLPALFGSEFSDAVPATLVLLVAAVPLAGSGILTAGLQADGAPLIGSAAEGVAIVMTVVGLALFLRPYGGLGAAGVSLAAYSASFAFQLFMATRRFGVPPMTFIMPTGTDLRWARSLL